MAVKIRLRRMGAKKKPFYRIVVADSRRQRDGKFIEEIGYYDPLKQPKEVVVNAEKANQWIANGAKPTDTVDRLFRENSVYNKEDSAEIVEESKEEATEKHDEAEANEAE